MARETKVGLLAGLAFIICFAIILANRSHDGVIQNQVATLTQSKKPVSPSRIRQRAVPDNRRRVDSTRLNDPQPRQDMRRSNGQADERSMQLRDRRGADRSTRSRQVDSRADIGASRRREVGLTATNSNSSTQRDEADRSPNIESDDRPSRTEILQRKLDELDPRQIPGEAGSQGAEDSVGLPANAGRPRHKKHEAPKAGLAGTTHIVVAGDTLTEIAGKYFGSKSRKNVLAIFEANRAVLSEPDSIRVGMKLVIPKHQIVSGATKPAPKLASQVAAPKTNRSRKPSRPAAHTGGTGRWYEIKKNDRYASIARKELGDVGRWREIFELNKAKFPNPQLIREGVRIRLPLAKTGKE